MTRRVFAQIAAPTLIAGCALIGGLGAAWASPQICPIYPSEQWMPMAQVEQRARAMGYDKFFVQPDGGCWGVYARLPDGARMEILLDPKTGAIVRQGRT